MIMCEVYVYISHSWNIQLTSWNTSEIKMDAFIYTVYSPCRTSLQMIAGVKLALYVNFLNLLAMTVYSREMNII